MIRRDDDAEVSCAAPDEPWKLKRSSPTAEQRRKARLIIMSLRNDKMKGKVTLAGRRGTEA